jgi:hypothetical protein
MFMHQRTYRKIADYINVKVLSPLSSGLFYLSF